MAKSKLKTAAKRKPAPAKNRTAAKSAKSTKSAKSAASTKSMKSATSATSAKRAVPKTAAQPESTQSRSIAASRFIRMMNIPGS